MKRFFDTGRVTRKYAIAILSFFVSIMAANTAFADGGSDPFYIGFWGGVDPLDGGYAHRSIITEDNLLKMIGRDSFFSLCDGTDQGVIEGVERPDQSDRETLVMDVTLRCFNNGSEVDVTHVYEIDRLNQTLVETVLNSEGNLITTIVFHRMSSQR